MINEILPECPSYEEYAIGIARCNCRRATGTVSAIVGDRIDVIGLNVAIGAHCRIIPSNGTPGIAKIIGFRDVNPILSAFDDIKGIAVGDRVELITESPTIPVGAELLGRVIDALGRPLDDKPLPACLDNRPVEVAPPSSLDRPPIDTVFETGIRAIDGLLTCGVGQRLGIFAGAGVGKSTLQGMLARSTRADAIVIGLVGERGREVREFIDQTLGEKGMSRSVIVVSTNDQSAAMRIQAAWTASAIAAGLRDSGKNVVLLLDSITRFATAQREIGLAAGEPPTTRGYPPSVFAQLPKLLEQSGRTNEGAITAFYTVLVDGDDTNEPISDALRGLLDGHIILSRKLSSAGQWPAIDILESLSRLQAKLISKNRLEACMKLRDWMSKYRTNEDLINIGAYRKGTNAELDKAIDMQPAIKDFLAQQPDENVTMVDTQKQLERLTAS